MPASLGSSINKTVSRHGGVVVVAAAAGIVLIGIPAVRLITLRARLDKAVANFWSAGPYAREVAARSSQRALLPPDLGDDADEYRVFYDVAAKSVAKAPLLRREDDVNEAKEGENDKEGENEYDELLTKYLRHTMLGFRGFPQAWLLWAVAGGRRDTFARQHVQALRFVAGDVVNGAYRVLRRDGNVVVFGIAQTGPVEGRLVVSIGDETEALDARTGAWVAVASALSPESERALVKTETFVWVRRAEGVALPLERRVARWLHEVASWWLIDEGTKWLASH